MVKIFIYMSMQGTWADHIVTQAVVDSLNLRIHIVESNANFSDLTLVEPMNTKTGNIRSIYLGHIGEMHYVSTLQAEFRINSTQTGTEKFCENLAPCDFQINYDCKTQNSVYMKEYRKKKSRKGHF